MAGQSVIVCQWMRLGVIAVIINLLPSLAFAANNDSLLWGPYRPNVYFGIRPRIPKSLFTSLLWSRVEDYNSVQNTFRYTCEQNDNMAGYGWDEYDARTGGFQTMHDVENQIDITTHFVKIPGGSHGGNWGARIIGTPRDDAAPDIKTSVVFAINMDGPGNVHPESDVDPTGYEGSIIFGGETPELGDFKLEVTTGPATNLHPSSGHPSYEKKPLDRTMVNSMAIPVEALWQTKAVMFQMIKSQVEEYIRVYGEANMPPPSQMFTIPNGDSPGANVHIVQKVFEGGFEFDVLFSSSSAPHPITSEDITREIKANQKTFSDRYGKTFKRTAPFDVSKYDKFSKSLFSNLLGGVGYFYGDSIADVSYAPEYEEENEGFWTETAEAKQREQPTTLGPYELFTSIPSRPFFPRGFLWDEGFHLLPIFDWDPDLTLEVLLSWFKLANEDGWIAREQILGHEARSKVPPEFQVQYPHIANPPTLFLVFENILGKLDSLPWKQKDSYLSVLRELYPILKRHYFWYRRTQKGDLKSYEREAFSTKEAYRWRGRTEAHILASGLDDYPRPQPPHPGELHVDLMSWMGLMTRSMKLIASTLGESDDASEFGGYETAITRNLDDLHWSEDYKTYCDATIDAFEETVHVCHKGYISIFPFMTGMLSPKSAHLGPILDLIGSEDELWSQHGIRSLSKKDKLYGTDENYWRSPVWMNMNYLILTNLQTVAESSGPYQKKATELYTSLRKNLVETVYESWKDTGFAWEQYNPDTGKGQRTAHFTGWTSLVVKIMSMPDLDKGGIVHGEL